MFADLELARRLESTEGFAGASFVEARGGDAAWERIAGAYAMFDGVGSPLTQTFCLGMFEPATGSVLTQLEEFFRTRGASVDHEVCPLAGVALLHALINRGYAPLELSNVLFLELNGARLEPALNLALSVRIAGEPDRTTYAQATALGWGMGPELAEVMSAAAGYLGFMVEKEGRAIATAGLVIHDRVALLAGAATIPEARGQGAQRAGLVTRLRHATESGCDLAMIVTEPGSASQRNAERNGFRVAYTRTKWRLESQGLRK
jgi:GNAT superfamily N-acetyltransferase